MRDNSAVANRLASYRMLVRGESLVASVGICAAAILLAMIGLAGWWSVSSHNDAWRFVRGEQVRVLSSILASSAETMLAGDDLSALRRLLIQAKQQHDLDECRIILPDGGILADADPTRITANSFPDPWPSGPIDQAMPDRLPPPAQSVVVAQPLFIRGRGPAILRISAPTSSGLYAVGQSSAGIGLIGAAGLAALLILYRHIRSRVLTLSLIRESLLAARTGSVPLSALTLRSDLGPEADAWNRLLDENSRARQAGIAERVKGSLGAVRESRSDLERACDALTVGMIVVNEQARITHANGAAAILLNAKRDQVVGRPFASLIDDREIQDAVAAIVAGSGQRRTIEISRGVGTAQAVLRVHARPLRREDAGGALVTIEDITQQRVADTARNSFVAQATHELRTPLTNMRLCLEDALENPQADPVKLREHFNLLNQETRRLERMVGQMLSMAEIEAGSLQLRRDTVYVEKLLEELQADYRQQAQEKQISLKFELPPKFPTLIADRDKLMVVLHNLLGNALKYTPSGGKVTVVARVQASNLIIDVIDTGIGIAAEEQEKIFDRFYRGKDPRVEQVTGTGLGLALARQIARLLGGDIVVQSQLDKGSTFTLILPIAQQTT